MEGAEFVAILTVVAGLLAAFYKFMSAQQDKTSQMLEAAAAERKIAMEQASLERRALITSNTAAQENDREERKALIKAIEDMAKSNREIAVEQRKSTEEMRKGNREAKERNGHLGEQNVQIIGLVAEAQKSMTKAHAELVSKVECMKEQHVESQIVEHQQVKGVK